MSIAFFTHDAGELEAQAVYEAVMTGDLTTGRQQQKFVDALRAEFGFPRIALCNSGTSALFLALKAAGVRQGHHVVTTPFTGVWTVNPILMLGATPIFCDVDRDTYNLDPKSVAQRVDALTTAVMPVSVNGVPCDYAGLRAVTPSHVKIVCDDIEALGAMRGDKYVGADLGDDVSVNGFWVSKTVTTCSGGMITSGDTKLIETCAKLARHGHGQIGDMWNSEFGYNFAFPDPLATMGVAQLARWKQKQERLLRVRAMLDMAFGPMVRQRPRTTDTPCEFVYMIELNEGVDKRAYAAAMQALDVPTRPYFTNLMEAEHLRRWSRNCPVAEGLARRTIALPYHWKLTQDDVDRIARAHDKVVRSLS